MIKYLAKNTFQLRNTTGIFVNILHLWKLKFYMGREYLTVTLEVRAKKKLFIFFAVLVADAGYVQGHARV